MDESRMQWEQEVYREIQFQQYNSDSKMFTFETFAKSVLVEQELDQEEKKGSLTTMALLSFDDQKEANEFKNAIEDRKKQFVWHPHSPGSPPPTASVSGKFDNNHLNVKSDADKNIPCYSDFIF